MIFNLNNKLNCTCIINYAQFKKNDNKSNKRDKIIVELLSKNPMILCKHCKNKYNCYNEFDLNDGYYSQEKEYQEGLENIQLEKYDIYL